MAALVVMERMVLSVILSIGVLAGGAMADVMRMGVSIRVSLTHPGGAG
jgi:hypothetical protein